jgi:UDP-N-acetylmuramyl pentapeptide phosphotransferase/UDP-N-acetylglucosamine-1-phosphate transferase
MDGINGLLTAQAAFVFAMIWLLGLLGLEHGLDGVPAILAAACLGFLPFNFPRARIFLGDVGSGALGLLVAAALWWAVLREPRWIAAGLLLVSAFAIDATATLLQRFWRGRRWYSAHREHLYQWLVRSGGSHARVVSYYMAWNLLLAAPLALLVATSRSVAAAVTAVVLTYAAGIVLWCRARRAVIAGVRRHA